MPDTASAITVEAGPDLLTVYAREFTPAAMEYHRRELGRRGYRLAGPIQKHRAYMVEGPGPTTPLFDGEAWYAATFVKS